MYMKNILILFFTITILHAATTDISNEPWQEGKPPLTKSLCIVRENFALHPLNPSFASALAPIFTNQRTMMYVGTGRTRNSVELEAKFLELAEEMNPKKEITNYHWALMIGDQPCGFVQALRKAEGVYEAVVILSPSAQGKGLAQEIAKAMFDFLPDVSWMATADPLNIASISALLKNGFKYQGITYVKKYNRERLVYVCPSKNAAMTSKL